MPRSKKALGGSQEKSLVKFLFSGFFNFVNEEINLQMPIFQLIKKIFKVNNPIEYQLWRFMH